MKNTITSSYYYENTIDLTDTPRPHFEKTDLRVNKKQNQKQGKNDFGILKKWISQDRTKNFTVCFKESSTKILHSVINFCTATLIHSEFTNSKFVMIWLAGSI